MLAILPALGAVGLFVLFLGLALLPLGLATLGPGEHDSA
jgi:hypothetical protein